MRDLLFREKRRFDDLPAGGYRLIVCALCAMGLIVLDSRYPEQVQPVRHLVQQTLEPVTRVLSYPGRSITAAGERLRSQKELFEENKILRAELLQSSAQLQQLAESRAENSRLRALLDASFSINDHILNAEIISADPNANHHVFILNKGAREGMQSGMTVLDAKGIMGQVTEVTNRLSSLMLISDSRHSIPVRISRTDERAILTGTGDSHRLKLDYAPESVDIKVGDQLVSSGLGNNFPAGYPVATVTEVKRLGGREFAEVYARPVADLEHSRHVIVLFKRPVHSEQPVVTPILPPETVHASP